MGIDVVSTYQVGEVVRVSCQSVDGFSGSTIYLKLVTRYNTQEVTVPDEENQHATIRGLYNAITCIYGISPTEIAKRVRFRQDYEKNGDGAWHPVYSIVVKKDETTDRIKIDPNDLEATIAAMVDAFNLAVSQSR